MDEENEKQTIAEILGQETVSPVEIDYVRQLGEKDLSHLSKESQRLELTHNELTQQLKELAVNNYRKFIDTSVNTHHILEEFQQTQSKLETLTEKLPAFEENCNEFLTDCNNISMHRRLTSLTFSKINEITDFLDLPDLMNQCIMEENYETALAIAKYMRRVYAKNGNIEIFTVIQAEIQKLWITIIQNLLSELRSDIELPKCLQAVGYLRSMNVFSEAELRLKFLQARDSWLTAHLNEIPKDKPSQHLSRTIDLTRTNLFELITQYNAIFNIDGSNSINDDSEVNEALIFQSWISEKISNFLRTMEHDLSQCDSSSFNSILNQCMYFGLSFSRVGCDFRGLIVPIILKSVVKHFNKCVETTTMKFEKMMEGFTLINKIYSTNSSSSNQMLIDETEINNINNIQDFYPLAEYCNGFLSAFNDIRTTIPLAIVYQLRDSVEKSLVFASEVILKFFQQEHQAFNDVAQEQFDCFCKCFAYQLIPYLQNCLKSLVSQQLLAAHLGVNVQSIKNKNLLTLDKEKIFSHIQHLLPARIDPDL